MPTPGQSLALSFESYATRLPNGSCRAYWDKLGGVWTIGYGSTGAGITGSTIWTQQQAMARFEQQWSAVRAGVLRISPVLNGNRLEAVCSFAYNCGVGAYQTSTMHRLINAKQWLSAANQFQFWNHSGGKVVPGLTRRRSAERALFLSPSAGQTTSQTPQPPMPNAPRPTSPTPQTFVDRFVAWLRSMPRQ